MTGVTSAFYNPLLSYFITFFIVEDEIDSVFTLRTSG